MGGPSLPVAAQRQRREADAHGGDRLRELRGRHRDHPLLLREVEAGLDARTQRDDLLAPAREVVAQFAAQARECARCLRGIARCGQRQHRLGLVEAQPSVGEGLAGERAGLGEAGAACDERLPRGASATRSGAPGRRISIRSSPV